MLQDDPSLDGIGCVIFDELHERGLETDLSFALVREAQTALREDLRVIAMSATLDPGPVSQELGGAPVIESAGRMYPVDTRYLDREPAGRIEDAVASIVRRALAGESGSALIFLPGVGEIRRVEERLRDLGGDVDLTPLYGDLSPADQDRAIAPSPAGRRKVVLATSIAETSLTIEGVRIVEENGDATHMQFRNSHAADARIRVHDDKWHLGDTRCDVPVDVAHRTTPVMDRLQRAIACDLHRHPCSFVRRSRCRSDEPPRPPWTVRRTAHPQFGVVLIRHHTSREGCVPNRGPPPDQSAVASPRHIDPRQ
jgi:hypothetical protein